MKKASPVLGTPCSCYAIRKAARRATRLYDEILSPTGLRLTQYALLSNIERREPVAMTALAEAMAMDRTTLTRNIGPLERSHFVSIRPAGHGRTKVVDLTERGRRTLRAARPYWQRAQEKFAEILGPEGTRSLVTLAGVVERADLAETA